MSGYSVSPNSIVRASRCASLTVYGRYPPSLCLCMGKPVMPRRNPQMHRCLTRGSTWLPAIRTLFREFHPYFKGGQVGCPYGHFNPPERWALVSELGEEAAPTPPKAVVESASQTPHTTPNSDRTNALKPAPLGANRVFTICGSSVEAHTSITLLSTSVTDLNRTNDLSSESPPTRPLVQPSLSLSTNVTIFNLVRVPTIGV